MDNNELVVKLMNVLQALLAEIIVEIDQGNYKEAQHKAQLLIQGINEGMQNVAPEQAEGNVIRTGSIEGSPAAPPPGKADVGKRRAKRRTKRRS